MDVKMSSVEVQGIDESESEQSIEMNVGEENNVWAMMKNKSIVELILFDRHVPKLNAYSYRFSTFRETPHHA